MTKPVALIDVDGPLNLWGLTRSKSKFTPVDNEDGTFAVTNLDFDVCTDELRIVEEWAEYVFTLYWRTDLPEIIHDLSKTFDLVYCTTWNDLANEVWSPKIGVGELPVLHLPKRTGPQKIGHVFWKTEHIASWLHENGVTEGVWFDDECGRHDKPPLPDNFHPVHVWEHIGLSPKLVAHANRKVFG